MADWDLSRRSIFKAMLATPIGLFAEQQTVPPSAVGIKVGAGADRFGDVRRLPGGDLLYVNGNGTAEDKETARREYGIVNVGPPLSIRSPQSRDGCVQPSRESKLKRRSARRGPVSPTPFSGE